MAVLGSVCRRNYYRKWQAESNWERGEGSEGSESEVGSYSDEEEDVQHESREREEGEKSGAPVSRRGTLTASANESAGRGLGELGGRPLRPLVCGGSGARPPGRGRLLPAGAPGSTQALSEYMC